MATEPRSFKRLVLGLQANAPDEAIRFAADLAELLHLELHGVFFEDTSLHDLASIPFARELRTLGGGWRPLNLDQLSRDLEASARTMERTFALATRQRTTKCQFEIVRGRMVERITTISGLSDIVVVTEPANPAERASQQFTWLVEAAFRSAAAVLLLPPRIARRSGPVAVIAAAPTDHSIRVAADIAAATGESVVLASMKDGFAGDPAVKKLAAETGVTVKNVAAGEALTSPLSQLRRLPVRLVVLNHGVIDDAGALTLASTLQVPVLVVEPGDT